MASNTNVLFMLRRKSRLTQLGLATEVGITQTEVSWAENGYKIRNLEKLRDFFANHEATRDIVVENPDDLMIDWDVFRDRQREAVSR